MKKKTKQLLGLLAVAIVLAVAYVLLPRLTEQTPEETTPEVLDVTEFATEDIASYSYQNELYEIGFRVENGTYVNTEDAAFPVNTATVAEQLEMPMRLLQISVKIFSYMFLCVFPIMQI